MRLRTAAKPLDYSRMFVLMFVLISLMVIASACTFYGARPAREFSQATGGEGMERVFWKEVQSGNWVQVERALASNYVSVTPAGTFDRATALERYRQWQLKEYTLGDFKIEMNGTTLVVTYTISLNGTWNGDTNSGTSPTPLPSTPQRMMTVWQQQKSGWVAIAHSVSQQ